MGKKEFAAVVLNPKHETYVVHVAFLSFTPLTLLGSTPLNVYPFRRPQISGLIAEEVLTKVPVKYSDFADVFSPDLTSELPEHSRINNHVIKLVKGCQQPLYEPIYSLGPVELETLKAYIETNLANGSLDHPNHPPELPSYLIESQTAFSSCASTIEASITSQSRTDICCH